MPSGREIARLYVSVGSDLTGLTRGFNEANGLISGFAASATATGLRLSAALTAPLAALGGFAAKTAADYQGNMNLLQAITGATADQMAALGAKAKEIGADITIPATSAADAAGAMLELSKAGLSVADTLEAARGVTQLAAAANVDEATAAEIAANALNAFHLAGGEATNIANLLAAAANASSVEIQDVALSYKQAATVFANFQGPIVGAKDALVDMTTAIALLGNAGIKASDAGTSLRTMFTQLTGPSKVAQRAMTALYIAATKTGVSMDDLNVVMTGTAADANAAIAKMASDTGTNLKDIGDIAFDAAGNMRPFREIIDLVAAGTANLNDKQRDYFLTEIFGQDAIRAITTLVKDGNDAWNDMREKVQRANAAADLANARMKGLAGAVEGLKSQVETAALNAFEPLLGVMENAVRWAGTLVEKFDALDATTKQAAIAFAAVLAAAGPLLVLLGGLASAVAFLATPLGLLTLGLAAAAAALVAVPGLVDKVTTALDGLGVALGMALQGNFAAAWEQVKNVVGHWASELAALLLPLGQAAAAWVTDTAIPAILAALPGILSTVGQWAAGAAQTVGEQMLVLGSKAWTWITDVAIPTVQEMLPAIVQKVSEWAQSGAVAVGQALQALGEMAHTWVVTVAIPKTLEALPRLTAAIQGWATQAATTLEPVFRDLGLRLVTALWSTIADNPQLKSAVQTVFVTIQQGLAAIQPAIDYLTPKAQAMADAFVKLGEAVAREIGPTLKELGPALHAFGEVAKELEPLVGPLAKVLGTILVLAIGAAMDALRDAANTLRSVVHPAFEIVRGVIVTVKEVALDLADVIKSMISGVKAAFAGDWRQAFRDASDVVRSAADAIAAPIRNLVPVFVQIGKDIIGGLIQGLKSSLPDLQKAAADVANSLPDTIKRLLGIASPSTVMAETGEDVVDGLIVGLRRRKPALQAELDAIAAAFRTTAQTAVVAARTFTDASGYAPGESAPLNPKQTIGLPSGTTATSGTTVQGKEMFDFMPGTSVSSNPWPTFASGGVVPGPVGAPTLALVHGGETVLPYGQGMGGASITININGARDPHAVADEVMARLRAMMGNVGGGRGTNAVAMRA